MKKRFIEIAVKVIVAALTAFLTAITTTSCMGYGPLYGPLPKIVQISQMKSPLAVAGGFSLKLHSRVGSCVPAVASQQSWSAYCVIFLLSLEDFLAVADDDAAIVLVNTLTGEVVDG